MEKISLYRKYRPWNFENLVGQPIVKSTLTNALKNNQVSHAYIFSGPRGTGKTSCARLLAKALNCTDLKDGYEPCGKCDFCKDISEGKLLDLIEIDAASNRGIEEIRELKEKINFAPTRSKYKIYIIDEAHMLTTFAFNALLKTLEEPPAHSYFILATTELNKLPETIQSRCQCFDFKRISSQDLLDRLIFIAEKEKIKAEKEALEIIANYVDGGMRDAIGLLEQFGVEKKIEASKIKETLGISGQKILDEFYKCLAKKEISNALSIVQNINNLGVDSSRFIHDFLSFLRLKMLSSIEKGDIRAAKALVFLMEIFQSAALAKESLLPYLPLELAVIKATCGALELSDKDFSQSSEKSKNEKASADFDAKLEKKPKSEDVLPKKATPSPNGAFSLEELKQNWINLIEKVKTPSIQRSLKSGKPYKLEGNKLILSFFSNFHKEKVMGSSGKIDFEKVLKTEFGEDLILDSVVSPDSFSPSDIPCHDNDEPLSFEVPENSASSEKEPSVEEVLDIFGGKIV